MIKISSGIVLIYDDKLLLCHPTNSKWNETYSFPKGLKEDNNETLLETAIRETKEETGIDLNKYKEIIKLQHIQKPWSGLIKYKNKENKVYKEVIYYIFEISNLDEIGLKSKVVPKEQLDLKEIDWAGFLNREEAEKKIFWRFEGLLNLIE